MNKKPNFYLLFLVMCCLVKASAFEGQKAGKKAVFFADWGNDPVPQEIVNVLYEHPVLKLAASLPKNTQNTESLKPLIDNGQLEVALTLPDEPILPLIYETVISTTAIVKFAWQQDVWDIIANAGQKFYQDYSLPAHGLYMRSGIFSDVLIQKLHYMGLRWVNMNKPDGFEDSVCFKDDFVIFINKKDKYKNANECIKLIYLSSGPVTCVFFDKDTPLTLKFLLDFAKEIEKEKDVTEDNIVMSTPWQLYSDMKDIAAKAKAPAISSDLKPWLQKPIMWYYLNEARKVVEDYRNSGQATMDMLEKMKGEIYQLYRYELIDAIQKNPKPGNEELFRAGIANVYGLAKLPLPAWINNSLDYWSAAAEKSSYSIGLQEETLEIKNSDSSNAGIHIKNFKVTMGNENVIYSIGLDSAPANASNRIEIYIDLNNKYRVGSTDMLNETNAFLDPDDAWELALRVENGVACLFRSGRDKPKLIRKLNAEDLNHISISRNILRGNPLKWGYQAIILMKNQGSETWVISDFLSPDKNTKHKLMKKPVINLPALRYIEK
ncbi:MAG: hypothetical protein LHV68_07995 [Elusimicrobia bacterium]|nr:hypothetical protein [Candidatus Liberimonas magnetica]